MKFPRAAGLLLHPTSLPGRRGIGEIGQEARRFAACLGEMGQRIWQVLPLGPTGFGDSPYQSPAALAGNPLLIDLGELVEDGLLDRDALKPLRGLPEEFVDFGRIIRPRLAILDRACADFAAKAGPSLKAEYQDFRHANLAWLDDYALYSALKHASGGKPWYHWSSSLVRREPKALAAARFRSVGAMERVCVAQFVFARQWHRLRDCCRELGVSLWGDVPIFVAHDSVDVWCRQDQFHLDAAGMPTLVAGVPPDYFSEDGQLWGNPLYRWEAMAERDFDWWRQRIARSLQLLDVVRIDHFRGFEAYWEVAAGETTARNGCWVEGPGEAFFAALARHCGDLPIVAEDLGHITESVRELLAATGFPGMRVAQFSFAANDGSGAEENRPHTYPVNCVAYTGTHDNDTTLGWFRTTYPSDPEPRSEAARQRSELLRYLGGNGRHINRDMMRAVWSSAAHSAIAPLQDLLGLGSEARLNTPGKARGNWQWRFRRSALTPARRRWLAELTRDCDRV